ncbi:MAG TPA: AAA family ATPase [Nostocaceae cyanobacterium]|nr:AAA family ATPase [Nostocaceae cyanobacterium]
MNNSLDTEVLIPGYHLTEKLYTGARTLVYRGIIQANQQPVIVKLLNSEYPTFNELLQFRNQYTIAKNLRFSGIVSPLCLEPYRNGYALIMEDFGGISLHEYVKNHPLEITDFLEIAIQLADILNYLYHHHTIHKDIKPANILIHPLTKQIKLIDFSIASLLPKETQEIKNPNILEGTLAYIAPEQTGRMNRGIDYRADFYALGVTFFELLTGNLPFNSTDPIELVHCHIARQPANICHLKPEIPTTLGEIVNKLMDKNAEDRYQSALGLKYDLEKCLTQIKETGIIEPFQIGQRDICDRFLIPEKLYGREEEVQELLAAYERVSQGHKELMLVAGFSGIGKTAVINEIHKPIIRQRGYFIKGKFDQFNRNIPFFAFVQAFRALIGQLLTENDRQLQQWKADIIAAVGENGQVIVDVIPELEKIIGEQPQVPELSGNAAQNRFNLLWQKFIQVFTTSDRPLVIFLDDLQWADSASLQLIQLLVSQANQDSLLLIGAYRDNEIYSTHPLMLMLENIRNEQVMVNTITLRPLDQLQVNELVADTLGCREILALPLSQLVYQKTQGNPFFATQFLKALHQNGLIQFNFELRCWEGNIAQINQQSLTEDVVELMTWQLRKLPNLTQKVLQFAACIGNQFDLKTLAIVCEKSEEDVAAFLWQALEEGLILPQGEVYKFYLGKENHSMAAEIKEVVAYKFLHDRVQQAAYSLITEEQKAITHYQIGSLLWQNTSESELEEKIFTIANQLNLGMECIHQPLECDRLARLNLLAGKKAKASTAYNSALNYLQQGIKALPVGCWEYDYDLSLSLYTEATEAAYLQGNMAVMISLCQQVLQNAKNASDTARVYEVKIEAYTVQGQFLAAIDTAREFLQQINIEFPQDPTEQDLEAALQETQACLEGKAIAQLADLPEMQELELRAALRVLVKVDTPAYLAHPQLHRLLVLKEVALSVQYGNTSASAFAYAVYGLTLSGQVETIPTGYEFGQLALQLLAKFPDQEYQARVLVVVHHFITHWQDHASTTLQPLIQAYTSGLETGDLAFAGYGAYIYCFHAYFSGQELTKLVNDFTNYGLALAKIGQKTALNYHNIYHQGILNLIDSSGNPWELVGDIYDETSMLTLHQQTNDGTGLWHFYTHKLMLCYLFQVIDLAAEYADKALKYAGSGYAMINIPVFYLYKSLVKLALFPNSTTSQKEEILQEVEAAQKIMEQWVNYAPMNQLHRFQLVEAERYRVLGEKVQAMELYDQAIATAKANNYLLEEALANELAAKFYLDWGREKVAQAYVQEAYYCYARWGSQAKTDDLKQRYPQLLQPILQQQKVKLNFNPLKTIATIAGFPKKSLSSSSYGSSTISEALDLASVLKAAQTISSSIQLDELISNLSKIILENAGAEKCILMLLEKNEWQVRAITLINPQDHTLNTLLVSQSLEDCPNIPIKLIQYVKRTIEPVVIDNCQTEVRGVISNYMLKYQPKSAWCTPIIHQGKLVGIFYLENNLTQGVFTSDRQLVINFLCTQAAISLENALLHYQQEQQARRDLQQAQLQLIQSEKMSALGNLVAGVAHEMNNPLGFISASLKQLSPNISDVIEHLQYYQQAFPHPDGHIAKHAEEIEIDYLIDDLPKIILSMEMACDRLTNISTSLRTFSRADKDYKITFDIHEGIDSTILILKHRLKANAERPSIKIVTEYGDIPPVECFPGQINQVFMNLLANAIDAVEESNQGCDMAEIKARPNCITIRTSAENSHVKIQISDNGVGMSKEVQNKIFNQIFTTKAVGKGTGLGLAIAYQIIVEKHGGQISVESEPGKGTKFTVTLPIIGNTGEGN